MTWNASLIDGEIKIPIFGTPDEEGIAPVTGYVEGYHLNVAPSVTPEEGYDLADYDVAPTPGTPYRGFAGAETRYLRFVDEAEARLVLAGYWVEDA